MTVETLSTVRHTLTRNGQTVQTLTGGARGPTGATGATGATGPAGADATLNAALTSWSAITRASGFDTFTATPSSANLRGLLTDETGTGAAVFGTAPTISGAVLAGTTDLSGGQIKFPATQAPSTDVNTLDDYEEGTFTPAFAFGGAAVGVVYSTQNGKYTKVGNAVKFRIEIVITNKGSSTGAWTVTGLPFVAAAGAASTAFPAILLANATTGGHVAQNTDGTSTLSIFQNSTGSPSALTDANCLNNSVVRVAGTYFV